MSDITERDWVLIESAVKSMRFTDDEYYNLYEKLKEMDYE